MPLSTQGAGLQLAAAADLGLGGDLMNQQAEIAKRLRKKKPGDLAGGSVADDLGIG